MLESELEEKKEEKEEKENKWYLDHSQKSRQMNEKNR